MEEDWICVEKTHEYKVFCQHCMQVILIKQHGPKLNSGLIEKIFVEVHIDNTFDALEKYENHTKLDLEIDNKKCIKRQR
jgi:hypothetical protein